MPQFKSVSADEAQSKRKDHLRDFNAGLGIVKAAKAPASWNADKRSARFIMTTQQVDRYGDIVVTAGADIAQFLANPVGLLFHNSRTWPVAAWENVEMMTRTRPPRMEGDFAMLPPGGPVKEVDEAAWMIENGGIRACSIGFIPDWDNVEFIYNDDNDWTGVRYNAWELTECSVCAVPANAGAMIKSADGDMSLARELVEDVLDNWARSPEGLLMPRKQYEEAYKSLPSAEVVKVKDAKIANLQVETVQVKDAVEETVDGPITVSRWETMSLKGTSKMTNVTVTDATAIDKGLDEFVAAATELTEFHLEKSTDSVFASFGPPNDTVLLEVKNIPSDIVDSFSNLLLTKMQARFKDPVIEKSEPVVNEATVDAGDLQMPVVLAKTIDAGADMTDEMNSVEQHLANFFAGVKKLFLPKTKAVEAVEEPPVSAPADPVRSEAALKRAAEIRERLAGKGLIEA